MIDQAMKTRRVVTDGSEADKRDTPTTAELVADIEALIESHGQIAATRTKR